MPLHPDEHPDQRHLDGVEQPQQLVVLELRLKRLLQEQHGLAVGAAIAGGVRDGHRRERALRLPLPDQLTVRWECEPEPFTRQLPQGVRAASRIEHETREHRIIRDAAELHSRASQHEPAEIDVVSGLGHLRIFEQRPERTQCLAPERREVAGSDATRELAVRRHVREGEIPRAPAPDGERHPNERRPHGIERGRLCVERHERRRTAAGEQFGEQLGVVHHAAFGQEGRRGSRRGRRPRRRLGAGKRQLFELRD